MVIARAASPDHRFEATIVEQYPSAITDPEYIVYILKIGSKDRGSPLFLGENCENITLSWKQSRVLDTGYSKAIITDFKNFWRDPGETLMIPAMWSKSG